MGLDKGGKFDKIVRDIKSVKIQGARNIARAAVQAYFLLPSAKSKKILLASRPTEPMMKNVLQMVGTSSEEEIIGHFDTAQEKINKIVFGLIKNNSIILTHCHSTNVTGSLVYARKKGKRFNVYVTESRPLFQGRKTAKELRKAGIPVTMFVDSAIDVALSGKNRVTAVFIGADALIKKGVINKIGSGLIAKISKQEKTPFYVIADSWKFTKAKVPIEQRSLNEIWDEAPKNVKIKNPAFEFVSKEYIAAVITEHGLMKYDKFVKIVSRK